MTSSIQTVAVVFLARVLKRAIDQETNAVGSLADGEADVCQVPEGKGIGHEINRAAKASAFRIDHFKASDRRGPGRCSSPFDNRFGPID